MGRYTHPPGNRSRSPSPGSSQIHQTITNGQSHRNGKSRRTHQYSNKTRRCEKRLLYLKWTAGAIGVLFLILMVLTKFDIQELKTENNQLTVKSRKQEQELQEAIRKMQTLQIDVEELVRGRIPGLQPLEFDKTFRVNESFVRNVIFTLTGVGADRRYEYRLVIHNDSLNIMHPKAKVILFDELGIQVGSTEISKSDATTKVEYVDLKPGETRSYSAMVPLQLNRQPLYFLLTYD